MTPEVVAGGAPALVVTWLQLLVAAGGAVTVITGFVWFVVRPKVSAEIEQHSLRCGLAERLAGETKARESGIAQVLGALERIEKRYDEGQRRLDGRLDQLFSRLAQAAQSPN